MSNPSPQSAVVLSPPIRRFVWAALFSLGVLVAGASFVAYRYGSPVGANAERFAYASGAREADELPKLWQVPSFALHDQHGNAVGARDLAGRVWIADFVFTTCTSLCPLITAKMALLQQQLPDSALRFVSFSVDPEHDTSDALLHYAETWNREDSRWLLLRTEPQSLAALASGMRVAVDATGDARDPILHSKLFFLVDGSGDVRGVYDSDDHQALERLRRDARRLLPTPFAKSEPSSLPDAGPALFQAAGCAGCHDNPKVAPSLRGLAGTSVSLTDGAKVVADAAYVRESILSPAAKVVAGYLNLMPSYQGQLSTQQLDAVAAYVGGLALDSEAKAGPASTATAATATKSIRRLPARPKAASAGPPTSQIPSPSALSATNAPSQLATDPVCGMPVRTTDDTPHAVFSHRSYYFCSEACRDRFTEAPSKYLGHPPQSMP